MGLIRESRVPRAPTSKGYLRRGEANARHNVGRCVPHYTRNRYEHRLWTRTTSPVYARTSVRPAALGVVVAAFEVAKATDQRRECLCRVRAGGARAWNAVATASAGSRHMAAGTRARGCSHGPVRAWRGVVEAAGARRRPRPCPLVRWRPEVRLRRVHGARWRRRVSGEGNGGVSRATGRGGKVRTTRWSSKATGERCQGRVTARQLPTRFGAQHGRCKSWTKRAWRRLTSTP